MNDTRQVNFFMYHFLLGSLLFCIAMLSGAPSVSAAHQDLEVKVQLAERQSATVIGSSSTATVSGYTSNGWKELGRLLPNQELHLKSLASSIAVLNLDGHPQYREVRIDPPNDDAYLTLNKKPYRGSFYMVAQRSGFDVRNIVSLEQYLYSVVPSEMPASWPMDALKSQAVAARTFALVHLGGSHKRGYDLTATTASQVYQGVKAEHPRSTQAVNETRGQVVTFQGRPIEAYFHSTSGGQTEFGGDLWANRPYLKPVKDLDHASPKYVWNTQFSQSDMKSLLRAKLSVDVGDIYLLQPVGHTQGGRVKELKIQGSRGVKIIAGDKFRMALQLNSTFFNVGGLDEAGAIINTQRNEVPARFEFAGRGWGHGIGLSQWGARQMAINGMGYQQILTHYYQGVNVKTIQPLQDPRRYKIALL